jgi:hypothetical protein
MKVKSIKPIDKIPNKGIYTKAARTILKEFLNSKYEKAEVNIEEEEEGETRRTYNAMKSLIRRENFSVNCSIDAKKKKLYLSKA